jgi:hypothetical protein
MSLRLAIEGPCCAGKTTLGDRLIEALPTGRATIIPDYADFVGGGAGMPEADPPDWDAERVALGALLTIEQQRVACVPNPPPAFVLIDRSVLTLVAHCSGLDHRHPERRTFASCADTFLRNDPRPFWPEALIYLDVPHAVQLARNMHDEKFASDSIFMDPAYNVGFRDAFSRLRREAALPSICIDGTEPPAAVADRAMAFIDRVA